jgi:hypothetical protein
MCLWNPSAQDCLLQSSLTSSGARGLYFTPSHSISLKSILTWSSHFRSDLVPSQVINKILKVFLNSLVMDVRLCHLLDSITLIIYEESSFLGYNAVYSFGSQLPCSSEILPASCWYFAWPTRRHVPPKRRLTSNRLHGTKSQKIELFMTTVVRTSDFT